MALWTKSILRGWGRVGNSPCESPELRACMCSRDSQRMPALQDWRVEGT